LAAERLARRTDGKKLKVIFSLFSFPFYFFNNQRELFKPKQAEFS